MSVVDKPTLTLTPEQYREIQRLLKDYLPGVEAWAYGSRVTGAAKPWSDLDLVVFSRAPQRNRVDALREAFDDSDLPFRVDLFEWDEMPESFKTNIERQHIVLQAQDKDRIDA